MIETKSKKDFMTNEVMELLKNLQTNTPPSFGLMTPQHMIEHLTWTLKNAVKRHGEPEHPPTEKQLKFHKFIENGAVFKHFPSDKTIDDLPPLKYENLDQAKTQIGIAIHRFYDHFENNPDFKAYNPFIGELEFEELELFHYMHYRYHLWQFGLIETYP